MDINKQTLLCYVTLRISSPISLEKTNIDFLLSLAKPREFIHHVLLGLSPSYLSYSAISCCFV